MTVPGDTYDLVIIGAGPTGLFAAYYAGFRGLSMAVVDSLPEPGGQVTAMYPEKMIYDVGGFAEVRGRDLVDGLVAQAAPWKPTYLLGRKAEKLESVDGGVELTLDGGDVLRAGAVLITAGIGEFTPRPLPAGEGWLGRGMVHFVPSLQVHAGQHVVVVGGGDSAFDWVLALHPIAASVTLVHRRAKFRAAESIVRQVRDLGVRIITDAEVTRFVEAPDGSLSAVDVSAKGADDERLPAHSVVAALTPATRSSPASNAPMWPSVHPTHRRPPWVRSTHPRPHWGARTRTWAQPEERSSRRSRRRTPGRTCRSTAPSRTPGCRCRDGW